MGRTKRRICEVIEILCPSYENEEDPMWRVVWPEADGSREGKGFPTCEVAVQFALLIRTTIHINEGRWHSVVISDEGDQACSLKANAGLSI